MIGEFSQAFVQSAAEGGNFAGVFGDGFLPPAVGNRAQQGNQSGRRGQNHTLIHAPFDQAGIAVEGGGEK